MRYSFAFWEDDSWYTGLAARTAGNQSGESGAAAAGPVYHRVVKGESLWAIAKKYDLALAKLIAMNPQIKNPNLIHVGDEVRVG